MFILQKRYTDLTNSLLKYNQFVTEIKWVILNKYTFCINTSVNKKRPWRAKAVLANKSKAEGIAIPDCKLYYKATEVKQHGTGTKIHITKYNRIEDADKANV